MTPLEFMYWLKGYFDITRTSKLDPPNVDIIKKQMDEVLKNTTGFSKTQFTLPSVFDNNVPPSDFRNI